MLAWFRLRCVCAGQRLGSGPWRAQEGRGLSGCQAGRAEAARQPLVLTRSMFFSGDDARQGFATKASDHATEKALVLGGGWERVVHVRRVCTISQPRGLRFASRPTTAHHAAKFEPAVANDPMARRGRAVPPSSCVSAVRRGGFARTKEAGQCGRESKQRGERPWQKASREARFYV